MSMNAGDVPGAGMRIIRLEENSWFQEKKLKELEDALNDMQKQLDSLTRKTDALQTAYLRLQDYLQAGVEKVPDPLPPHYQQDR